jgi:hypothetical protein
LAIKIYYKTIGLGSEGENGLYNFFNQATSVNGLIKEIINVGYMKYANTCSLNLIWSSRWAHARLIIAFIPYFQLEVMEVDTISTLFAKSNQVTNKEIEVQDFNNDNINEDLNVDEKITKIMQDCLTKTLNMINPFMSML